MGEKISIVRQKYLCAIKMRRNGENYETNICGGITPIDDEGDGNKCAKIVIYLKEGCGGQKEKLLICYFLKRIFEKSAMGEAQRVWLGIGGHTAIRVKNGNRHRGSLWVCHQL